MGIGGQTQIGVGGHSQISSDSKSDEIFLEIYRHWLNTDSDGGRGSDSEGGKGSDSDGNRGVEI